MSIALWFADFSYKCKNMYMYGQINDEGNPHWEKWEGEPFTLIISAATVV